MSSAGSLERPARPVDLFWVQVRPLGHTARRYLHPVVHAPIASRSGTTALHLGDTQSDPATWVAAGVPAAGVDLALVPYWYALDQARFEALLGVLRAGTVVLLHTPRQDGDGWAAARRELQDRYRQVWVPGAAGEIIEVARRSPVGPEGN